MTTIDRWGCPVTADEAEAEVIDESIAGFLTMAPGVDRHFVALEAGGPLAKAILAQFLLLANRAPLADKARSLVADAEAGAADVSDRERGHIEAVGALASGRRRRAMAALDHILVDHPTDALALRTLYQSLFAAGRVKEMVELIRRVRPAWSDDVPLASLLDGHEAFGLEESGRYVEAEVLGRRGVERDPTDLWAIHAVAHVFQMQQHYHDGASWLDGRDAVLEAGGGFAGHLWWHQGLALLGLGGRDEVLDLVDRRVYPAASEEGLDLSNMVSLLARLEMAGVDVGDRWERVAGPCATRRGHHAHPFNDTHFALALARAGHDDALRAHLEGMAEWSERGDEPATVLRTVGLATAEGVAAWGQHRWQESIDHLAPVADQTWRLGGSHAQRDVYRQLLDHAKAKVGG